MTAPIGAFLQRNSIRAFDSPQVTPESALRREKTYTDRGQDLSTYPTSMRQSVGFAGEIGRVQRPSKRVRSEFNVRGREAGDSQIRPHRIEQRNSKQPSSLEETRTIGQPAKDTEEPKLDPPFINGGSRAFLGDYGGKNCLAMFITEDMVNVFAHIRESKELVANGIEAIKDAEGETWSIERDISRAEEDLDYYRTREEEHQICVELAHFREALGQAERRVEKLKKRLKRDESNLRRVREDLEGYFGKVLEAEGLFGYLDTSSQPAMERVEGYAGSMEVYGHGWNPPIVEDIQPTLEELTIQAARENLERSLRDLMDVQIRFNERHELYMQAQAEYHQLFEMGEIDYSFTEFGLRDIERVQRLTRELINAEENYKAAKMHAKDVGSPRFDPYQSSDFVDREDDGYRESEEAEEVTGVDRDRIERWQYGVAHARTTNVGSIYDTELTEIDEWDARTVGLDDSASAVDCDRYCNKINLWLKHCSELRQGIANQAQADNSWASEERLLGKRSRSC